MLPAIPLVQQASANVSDLMLSRWSPLEDVQLTSSKG